MDDRTVGQVVGPALRALESFLSVVDRAKGTNVPMKGTVWEVAEDRVPGLSETESRARELRDELREWEEESERLQDSLHELESALEEGADYSELSERFAEAMDAMEGLDERSNRVEEGLRKASDRCARAAGDAAGIPVLGSRLGDSLDELAGRLSDTAEEVGRVRREPADVIEVYPRAERRDD